MRKKAALRGLAAALFGFAVVAGAVLAVPDLRLYLLGGTLRYHFGKEPRHVAALLSLKEGQVIRGDSEKGEVPFQEDRDLRASLEEQLQSGGSEQVFDYRLGELRTEQFAWDQNSKLSGTRVQVRVTPLGGVAGLQPQSQSNSPFLQPAVAHPIFYSLWPRLPSGWLEPVGAGWSFSSSLEVKGRMLDQPVVLEHRLTYKLDRYFQDQGRNLAEVTWTGTVAVRPPATGGGNLWGNCIFDTENGQNLAADYLVNQEFSVPLNVPGSDQVGVNLAWRQAQKGRVYLLKPGAAEAR